MVSKILRQQRQHGSWGGYTVSTLFSVGAASGQDAIGDLLQNGAPPQPDPQTPKPDAAPVDPAQKKPAPEFF